MATAERRVFLGWDRPLPKLAVERLFSLIDDRGPADFGAYRILVPTAEAGRLLREAAAEARAGSGGVINLDILMPDTLLTPEDAPSPAAVLATWCRVLKRQSEEHVQALFGQNFPKIQNDAAMLLNAANLLQNCRRDLAEDGLSPAEAAAKFRAAGIIGQAERFTCLAELEQELLRRLPAEPVAAMLRQTPPADDRRTVIVLHCPDLRGAAAKFLDRWPGRVEYWIHAPGSMRDRFDRQGRALKIWREEPFEIDPAKQIRIAARAADQVNVLEDLRKRGLPVRAVGVLDPEIAEAWRDRLRSSPTEDMPVFFPATRPLSGMPWTRAFTLLLALRGEDPTGTEIAALLHHGSFADREVLASFDQLQKDTIAQDLAALSRAAENAGGALRDTFDRIAEWRRRLRTAGPGHLSVAWDILRSLGESLPPERIDVRSAGTELAELEEIVTAAEQAAPGDAPLAEAIARHLIRAAKVRPVPTGTEKMDAVGFLELGWYGDPIVIAAGFSENAMGYGKLADPFLPEQAKALLGLRTAAASQAADAFRFTALRHSAELRFLIARFSARGDALKLPSLLLQCHERELPARVALLFGTDLVLPKQFPTPTRLPGFVPRRETPQARRLSVTDFAGYMRCPFAFYLQKVLRIENADDRSIELDPAQAGTLLHDVIADCTDTMRSMTGAPELLAAAAGHLRRRMARYGTPPPGLLTLQSQIMEDNLRYFAETQAARQDQGWRVIRTEKDPASTTLICSWADFYHRVFPDGARETWRETVEFKGRFDRLDARELPDGTRELCVIDYKTGKDESPAQKHWGTAAGLTAGERVYRLAPGKGFWQDLQLPLYILMIRHLLPEERADRIRAAYFALPAAYSSTRIAEFDELDEPLLASAMHCADEIARRIYGPNPVFWPPRRFDTLFAPYAATEPENYDAQDFYREAEK